MNRHYRLVPIARPGWSNRFQAAAYVIGEALFLPALILVVCLYVWLLAPAGAAYPR